MPADATLHIHRPVDDTDPSTWTADRITNDLHLPAPLADAVADTTGIGTSAAAQILGVQDQSVRILARTRHTALSAWEAATGPVRPLHPDVHPGCAPARVDGRWPAGLWRLWAIQTGRLDRDLQPVGRRRPGQPRRGPVPQVAIDASLPESTRRMAALLIGHRAGWWVYLGPTDPHGPATDSGYTIIRGGRYIDLHADEVLPYVQGYADRGGDGASVTYREGF